MPTRRSNPAFTLVEVLVSIAVIALLIALLLPALGGARESARQALCFSNIRQIALANDLYAQDHADRYAPGAADILANLHRWHGSRPSASAPFTAAGGSLTPYLSADDASPSTAIRACPSFVSTQLALADARLGFERSAGGYGYNNAFVGSDRAHSDSSALWVLVTDRVGSQRFRFTDPGGTVAFADAALADGNPRAGVIEYSFIEPRYWPDFSPPARPDPSVHFRHPGAGRPEAAASAAWLDGHTSTEHRTFTVSSGLYAGDPVPLGTGWFGRSDDNALFDY